MSDWSITNLLENLTSSMQVWGGLLIALIGIVLIIAMAVIGRIKLISGGCQKWGWPLIIVGLFIGGVFFVGGLPTIMEIASGGHATINDLGR